MTASANLVDVEGLTVDFRLSARGWRPTGPRIRAVDDVSFAIPRHEVVALVGESGSGKTTVGRTVLRLISPTSGSVRFEGSDVFALGRRELRSLRRRAQMVFQDPYASLNSRLRVRQIIEEPLRAHRIGTAAERRARVDELLDVVGLPQRAAERFPHAFSGGQRQRICIARALALRPDLLIADEPVSSLDVSIQAQVVNLLKQLQVDLGLTLLFIAHDLAVVRHTADQVVVMYLGAVVESGPCDAIFESPLHPYTQSLLSAVPVPDPVIERTRQRIVLQGDPPSPLDPPPGCRFHTRCPVAMPECRRVVPPLRSVGARRVACHLVDSTSPGGTDED